MSAAAPVYFYIEKSLWPRTLPDSAENYWDWFCSEDRSYEAWHIYHWVLRTFVELRDRGLAIELIDHIPEKGIVFAHRFSLPDNLIPGKDLYLVCILADKRQPGDPGAHFFAQEHVVQNPLEEKIVEGGFYIPNWPQPGIKPRNGARGNAFENIAYFGSEKYLDPKTLKFVTERFKEMGMRFIIRGRELRHQWHDYSEIDGVLAFRDFNEDQWSWKPATKLYNAWLAGVPAVLSPEPAFRALRKTPLDYIEVKNPDEIVEAFLTLKNDSTLRLKMIDNAKKRAAEFTPAQLISQWIDYLQGKVLNNYNEWRADSFRRSGFVARRKMFRVYKRWSGALAKFVDGLRIKLKIKTRLNRVFK